MNENLYDGEAHFFQDNGSEINPELISKPALCLTCKKDNDPQEEILCILTRADQQDEAEFICGAYEPLKKF